MVFLSGLDGAPARRNMRGVGGCGCGGMGAVSPAAQNAGKVVALIAGAWLLLRAMQGKQSQGQR